MRAFDEIYVHPSFTPEPSPPPPARSAWPAALVGTVVTVALASGVGLAVGAPGILSALSDTLAGR